MKGRPFLISVLALGLMLALAAGLTLAQGPGPQGDVGIQAAPVSTSFTYQGRLNDGGNPANGSYDFEFKLYDAAGSGTQVGSTIPKNDVAVSDGLFTVELDFGSGRFTGDARWLEIGARPGDSTGAYTTLTPRQALTATPYAVYALGAPWSGLTDVPPGFADGVDDTGSAGPHDHWGETWSGSGIGLTLNSSNEDGLRVSGGDDGIQIESASDDGVFVKSAGQDGILVDSPGRDGVSVVDPGSDGFYVNNAGDDGLGVVSAAGNGVQIDSAGNDGVHVESAGGDGVDVYSADDYGIYVGTAGKDGVYVGSATSNGVSVYSAAHSGFYVYSAGHHGVFVQSPAYDGVQIESAGRYGVHVESSGSAGVRIESASGNGVRIASSNMNGIQIDATGDDGVHIESAGDDGVYVGSAEYGVYVRSADTDGVMVYSATDYAAWFEGDVWINGDCTGCGMAEFGRNVGQTALEPGDVVAVRGVTQTDLHGPPVVMEVGLATGRDAAIGVVAGRAELDKKDVGIKGEAEIIERLVPREGPVQPGEYVSIIIYGLAQVKATTTTAPIEPGTRLTAADSPGHARAVQTVEVQGVWVAESGPVIGVALEKLESGQGLIWVLVNPH